MNILILNWRDIKNPSSGGAEVLTHEIAKRWVKLGNQVTLFSSHFSNSRSGEVVDGVRIIRKGHPDARFLFSSVHFLAYKFYRNNLQRFDVVVDEIHGLPFFTPWYVKEKKVVLICEVAGDLWIKMFGPILGPLGRFVEKIYLQFIYKDIVYLTISNSTKEELIKEGVNSKNITVLPMGLTIPENIKNLEKEKDPTLIFVGRLTRSKGIEDAIEALRKVLETYPKTKLWIVGGGSEDYIKLLKKIGKNLGVSEKITFWGFVSEEKKFELMGRAHILVAPSIKEGWGLIVQEAARVKTPSIVYDVPGLRDAVVNNKTGIILPHNSSFEMAKQIMFLLNDKKRYKDFQKNALSWSKTLSWDNTAKQSLKLIKSIQDDNRNEK